MKRKYKALKDYLMAKYPKCEVCNKRNAAEVGHCLYHIHKRKFNPIFDSIENCQSNCHQCNMGAANARSAKKAHWKKRCEELGREYMLQWNSQIPKWRREGFE